MPWNGWDGCISELDVVAPASVVRLQCPHAVNPRLNLVAGGGFMQQRMIFWLQNPDSFNLRLLLQTYSGALWLWSITPNPLLTNKKWSVPKSCEQSQAGKMQVQKWSNIVFSFLAEPLIRFRFWTEILEL